MKINSLLSSINVYIYLSDIYIIRKDKNQIINSIRYLQINEIYTYKKTSIKRIAKNQCQVDNIIIDENYSSK